MNSEEIIKARQTVTKALENSNLPHSHSFYSWHSDAERITGFSVRDAEKNQSSLIAAWLERACRIRSFTPKAAFMVSVYKIAAAKSRSYVMCSNFDHNTAEERERCKKLAENFAPVCQKAESECLKLLEANGYFAHEQLRFIVTRTEDETKYGDFCVKLTAESGDTIYNGGIMGNYSLSMTVNAMMRMADENYESITYAPKSTDGAVKISIRRSGERFETRVIFLENNIVKAEFTENMSRNRLKRFAAYFSACEHFLDGEDNFWY